jgi:purine nucleosidase
MHTIILDTDIGSDVDDALALATVLGSESVNLLGITTVYGDTKLRTRIAHHLCHIANRSIPVFAGVETPLSGREVWSTGSEGKAFSNLNQYALEDKTAVEFLVETVNQNPGEIEVIAIGPLSNIATAIVQAPDFAKNVKHLWVMGGDFTKEKIEHNFKCDIAAAKIVLESEISITILDLPSSQKTIIKKDEIEKIKSSGKLGPILYTEILNWIQPRNQDWTTPHDPIAVIAMLEPELFSFSDKGSVQIGEDGKSDWRINQDGNVKRVSPSRPLEAVSAMISRLTKVN